MPSLLIFISHSSQDVKIAECLIELLRGALNLAVETIRCTSVDGYRLPVGASTEEQLRQEVLESTAFIGLITQASIHSAYVLFELGARWGIQRHLAPLLAAGADVSVLRGPLSGLNALSCDNPAQVHQLVTDIARLIGVAQNSPSAYQKHLDALVRQSKLESESRTAEKKELLIESSDTNVVYLVDRYGLPHPIKDASTASYVMEMLGYQPGEPVKVPSSKLKPVGADILSINDWRVQPRTEEEARERKNSFDAMNALKILKKETRVEKSGTVLSIHIRNNSKHDMQLDSVVLVLSMGELAESDISSRNRTFLHGLLNCALLFNGINESQSLSPQQESTLDLFFARRLGHDEEERVKTVKLGYLEVSGVFQETKVNFHKDV